MDLLTTSCQQSWLKRQKSLFYRNEVCNFWRMDFTNTNSVPLRRALLANAAFSLITGSMLAATPLQISALLSDGVPPWTFAWIGAVLVPFGGFVAWLAFRRIMDPMLALAVSIADLAWVAGTAVLIALAGDMLKPSGIVAIIVVATFVFGFAIGQLMGITRLYVKPGECRFRVCLDINSDGDADVIWENLANLGDVARFAPTLTSSVLRGNAEPGVGSIRTCIDRSGRSWSERCVGFDHERKEMVMQFLAEELGFPFPFAEMSGGWSIQTLPSGAVVRVWWEGLPKYPHLNAVLLPLLSWQARRQFPDMVLRMSGGSEHTTHSRLRPVIAPC